MFTAQTSLDPDLMYVLAEGWNGGELTNEVEVGSGKRMNSTAVKHRQSLIGGQSQVLNNKRHQQ